MASTKKTTLSSNLRWLLFLLIPALWCVLTHFEYVEFLENKFLDWRFQYRGEVEAPLKIVYVDIDTVSISELGNLPWNRAHYAKVASALVNEAKVKAVGIDVVFSDAGMSELSDRRRLFEGNMAFGRFLSRQPPVVLAASYAGQHFTDQFGVVRERRLPYVDSETRPVAEIEPPETPAFERTGNSDPRKQNFFSPPFVGLIDTHRSETRSIPAWAPNNERAYFHMAVELARIYWGLPPGSIRVNGDQIDLFQADGQVRSSIPLRFRQFVEINWFSKWGSKLDAHEEFSDVWAHAGNLTSDNPTERKEAKDFFAQEEFKDAVVLIGPVDKLIQDLAPTSLDEFPVPKVSVHGNMLKTIVTGKYLGRFPMWRGIRLIDYAVVFGLTVLVSLFAAAGGTKGALSKLTAALLLTAYVFLAFWLFKENHLLLPMAAPLGAAFSTSFAAVLWQLIDEEKAKGRIKGMFRTYLSPQLVEQMVESGEDPKLGGDVQPITAYFSDIQSFSSFSELLTPQQLVELMNEYLTACTDIVQAQGGTLDKYIGDAVVAMFGAPIPLADHAYRACVATQLVHVKLAELRVKWTAEGDRWPEIVKRMQSRIGINSGPATIGNMGSTTRFNYTMMGDNVNLAARMESGAKSWGAYTMCTEATRAACVEHGGDRVVFRPLSKLVVKGRSQPVPVYEIVGLKESVAQQARDCVGLFEQALEKYYARDWEAALKLFAKSRELEWNVPGKTPGVVSNPSIVYIERVVPEAMAEPPSDDWDGRYIMHEK